MAAKKTRKSSAPATEVVVPAEEASASTEPAGEIDGANLGQVREILFGNQIRDIDQRFAKMEARRAKDVVGIRSDVKKRLESMDLFVKNEIQALSDSIRQEQSDRTQALKEASRELTKTGAALEKKLTRLDDRMTKTERNLNQHLLDQVNSLREDLQERTAELEAVIERESGVLDDAKTDRAALASLLQEMALRLTNGFDLSELG